MLFIHSYKIDCFNIFVFLIYDDVFWNILSGIWIMTVKQLKNFIFEKYYGQIEFTTENNHYSIKHRKKKDLLLLGTKVIKMIPDASNAKEYYRSFFQKKKMMKQ